MKLNERKEIINVFDTIFGREISVEHMVDLIVATEWDDNVFEHTTLSHLTVEKAYEEVKNNLEHYMNKHEYEWLEKENA